VEPQMNKMNQVAAIVLAAGGSARFGQPKQLLDWGGKPLLAHVTDVALAAGLDPVIVVLGCRAQEAREVLGARPVRAVVNWRWEAGLSSSVQVGLASLPPQVEAAIFLQCDQPLVTPELLRSLATRFEETARPIVHPTHAGKRGTPVLLARSLFSELAGVGGDEGGRSIIARHPDAIATVEVTGPDTLSDVDTPQDYQRLLAARHSPFAIRNLHHLIVDMDGVLWRGDEPLPGLCEFFNFLQRKGVGFILATNNSSQTPEQYVAKLARFGVEVAVEHILTSAQATAAYLADQSPPGARVYAIGGEGLQRALEQCGFVLADEDAAYAVVGWDRQLTWDKLATAALLIHEGAEFVGTNPDRNYPTARGPVPGNGAQLALLEATTGVAPVVIGKPEAWMYEEALRRMGARPESTTMLGDRLDTDIAGAARIGLSTLLVLSGIATEADLTASLLKPDLVCADIGELVRLWERALLDG